jgi:hypothetical protein
MLRYPSTALRRAGFTILFVAFLLDGCTVIRGSIDTESSAIVGFRRRDPKRILRVEDDSSAVHGIGSIAGAQGHHCATSDGGGDRRAIGRR